MNRAGGRKAALWDRAQVEAFAAGEPVPELPAVEASDDLLDAAECAELAGIETGTWLRYMLREGDLVPEPDVVVHEQPHWRRGTVLEWQPNRPGSGAGGGRRPKNGLSEDELLRRAAAVREAGAAEGRSVSAREIGREVGVSPTKASRLLAALSAGESADPGGK